MRSAARLRISERDEHLGSSLVAPNAWTGLQNSHPASEFLGNRMEAHGAEVLLDFCKGDCTRVGPHIRSRYLPFRSRGTSYAEAYDGRNPSPTVDRLEQSSTTHARQDAGRDCYSPSCYQRGAL